MARTKGSRNAGYDERRLALARKVRTALMKDDGLRTSMRSLAEVAGTSVATLKHYFDDREGVMVAVMESMRIDGAPHMARASLPASTDVRESLLLLLQRVRTAWVEFRVGRMQTSMMAEGLSTKALGPAYVDLMLEPFLQVGEAFLRRAVDSGALPTCDVRQANLMLMSPVVLALMHQDSLSGASCRPLDLDTFVTAHVEAFLRAVPPPSRKASRAQA